MTTEDALIDRAIKAYRRCGGTDQPCRSLSEVGREANGTFVYLANVNGLMAKYKLHDIYGLKRVPLPEAIIISCEMYVERG